MANKVKYRKCPECGAKMTLKKSHSKGTKFWGCTQFRDTGCSGSAEYFGGGARAGLNLDIREIKNGYIITTFPKYAESVDDDDPVEQHVTDLAGLSGVLKEIFDHHVVDLQRRIENSTEFTDEIDQEKHEKRVKVAKRGTSNVDELLKRMAEAKKKAENETD